jgi:hypothetical protein
LILFITLVWSSFVSHQCSLLWTVGIFFESFSILGYGEGRIWSRC